MFEVTEVLSRAKPRMKGTYYKQVIHPDSEDPSVLAIVHHCDGTAKDCYIDGNGNIVVMVKK